eukprot:CAMPEP_0194505174 /NCGR_PEP_ID=MMETSP0253-20130528/31193_1 /TAXON_ID=2966 /ORGANISM="Noctiluca scintillans" /LENGTH=509 /DNA_ID=CAMNT_0039347673 /DNA_START=56 /DNA_END=1585 /DNA_ORIENTATION=-
MEFASSRRFNERRTNSRTKAKRDKENAGAPCGTRRVQDGVLSDITNNANAVVNADIKVKVVKPFLRPDRNVQPSTDRRQPCRSRGLDASRLVERDVQHAQQTVSSSGLRRCAERDMEHVEGTIARSALRRCTERDSENTALSGLRTRSVARSGLSKITQGVHEGFVRCVERDVQLVDICVASSALRTKSLMPSVVPSSLLPALPLSPEKEHRELPQAPEARGSDFQGGSYNDPQEVLEYEQPIHQLLLREQLSRQPFGTCLDRQPQLNAKMRAILIDWLVDVAANYKLRTLTLFLTVRLIDQYLDRRPVPRKQLQLVGVSAMLIAAKFEEICPPALQDFVYITADAYTSDDLIEMEIRILAALEFRISTPTAAHFLERVERVSQCDARQRHLAQFLLELTLTDYAMSRHLPSHLACSAVILSNDLLQLSACPAIADDIGVTESALEVCIHEMHAVWAASNKNELQAVRKKFRHNRYHAVSDAQFANVCMLSSSATVTVNEPAGNRGSPC